MRHPVEGYIRQFVCVEAAGVRYFGTLIELGEEEATLLSETRWITVPMEKISSIRPVDPSELETTVESVDAESLAPLEGAPAESVAGKSEEDAEE